MVPIGSGTGTLRNFVRNYYYYYYLLQLSFHSVAVVLTLVTNKNKRERRKLYKNTVQKIQNTVNTSTHITETPTQSSQNPYITKPARTHTHTLQKKLKQSRHKTHTK